MSNDIPQFWANLVAAVATPVDENQDNSKSQITNSESSFSENKNLKFQEGQVMTRLPKRQSRKRPANVRRSKYELLLLANRGKWVCLRSDVSPGLINQSSAKWVKRNHAEIKSRKIDGVVYIFGRIPK